MNGIPPPCYQRGFYRQFPTGSIQVDGDSSRFANGALGDHADQFARDGIGGGGLQWQGCVGRRALRIVSDDGRGSWAISHGGDFHHAEIAWKSESPMGFWRIECWFSVTPLAELAIERDTFLFERDQPTLDGCRAD